jgi:hypothetical protein
MAVQSGFASISHALCKEKNVFEEKRAHLFANPVGDCYGA